MTQVAEQVVVTKLENGVFYITMNRPESLNSANEAMLLAMQSALSSAEKDDNTRVIVITGSGRGFCSGADLSALQKISESNVLENWDDAHNLMELFAQIRKVKIPVIAAVHGRALAGGSRVDACGVPWPALRGFVNV